MLKACPPVAMPLPRVHGSRTTRYHARSSWGGRCQQGRSGLAYFSDLHRAQLSGTLLGGLWQGDRACLLGGLQTSGEACSRAWPAGRLPRCIGQLPLESSGRLGCQAREQQRSGLQQRQCSCRRSARAPRATRYRLAMASPYLHKHFVHEPAFRSYSHGYASPCT